MRLSRGDVLHIASLCRVGLSEEDLQRMQDQLSDILAQFPGHGAVRVHDDRVVRDFLWIGDAVAGLIAIAAGSAPGIVNLGTGRGTAIGELALPPIQPGSSIMPGKVNPVMAESVMQVVAQVIGNDAAVAWSNANGNFELNVMMPVLAHNLLESAELIGAVCDAFREKCVEGIEANEDRAAELLSKNIVIITALAPKIGYDKAAEIAKKAFATGRGVKEVALEMEVLPADELDRALDPYPMTEGGIAE